MLVLSPDAIERIDILSEQILEIAKELKDSKKDSMNDALIIMLLKESRNLKAIYNEFCWLETFN